MKFLALTLYLVVRITLTLISSPAIIGCFRKASFQGFNLVIGNFQLSAFLRFMGVIRKISCFVWKYSVFGKTRESSLCATNRYIKVAVKLILPLVSRFKFCPYYKSRVKLIFIWCNSIKVSHKTIKYLLTVLQLITIMSEQYCVIYFGFLYFHQRNY